MSHLGQIIGIEGIDSVGKQTQSNLLKTWLKNNGYNPVLMSFPDYQSPIGKEINSFLRGEVNFPPQVRHMLFAANRWEKVSLITSYKEENRIIIVNRYTESNIVYGAANGLSIDWLWGLESGIPKTNLVIVLDAPAPSLVSRRPSKDSYESDDRLQLRARTLYKQLAPKFDWQIVKATEEVEKIHESILSIVKEKILKQTSRG